MGFKFKRIDFTAGTAEFPTGNSDANIRTRCEVVLKGLADALIGMNIGWRLDPNRANDSATTSNFAEVPCQSGAKTYPGLFFDNTVSGCKLFLSSFSGYVRDEEVIKNFGGSDLFGASTTPYISGIIASIIPAGSSNNFGQTFDSSFLPSDATRLVGTNNYRSNLGTSYYPMILRDPTSGYIYSYGIFANEYVIAVSCGMNSANPCNLSVPVYATGRVLGTIAHAEDTAINSKYGVIVFRMGDANTNTEGNQSLRSFKVNYRLGDNFSLYYPGINPNNYDLPYGSSNGYTNVCGCVSKSDGIWLNGAINNSSNVVMYVADTAQMSGKMFNSTGNGKSRWVPIEITIVSSDLDTNGVVTGDGFKGYLDTDLFRCALGTYGQLFDNGNFIYIWTVADNCLLLGWDPDNTDSIGG